ncbi:hypothetical protein [Streptomyces sp. NBC_01237]|uniref:hypothetical protein n=1 Tax=Streptomyces sp. NBC_01237 TaxID=2903790 RepID=UPI002DDAE4E8|nr:hypothetical protein [Streptomyces sp. NBC_01237]WRZ77222.1 hypothetical protein OG251_36800 [Streptomyces sp. NBC_01237]
MPPYIGYLDMAEIQKWVGHAMVRLGTSTPGALRRGREALDFAHASWPTDSVRGAAEMLTSSASIYLDSGEREAADSVINAAVTIAQDTGSARNLRDALAVRTRMAAM